MRRRLAARLLQSLIIVVLVTVICFFVERLAPGDPFSYENPAISLALRNRLRAEYGYGQPAPEQFFRYVANVAHGQLGFSWTTHQPVWDVLRDAVPRTLLLMVTALLLSFLIGIAVGVMQASRRGGLADRVLSPFLLICYSLPDFWFAILALLLFGYWLPILPAGGMVDTVMHDFMSPAQQVLDVLRHLILPAATLTLLTTAGIARFQRGAMLEVLSQDFIRTARAKGVSDRRAVWRHALRAGLTPVVTLFGLLFPALLGGAVFVERVFGWPGMGLVAADAVARQDYDLITAAAIIGALMVAIGNLLADLLLPLIDPRARD